MSANISIGCAKPLNPRALDPNVKIVVVFDNDTTRSIDCVATTIMGIAIALTVPKVSQMKIMPYQHFVLSILPPPELRSVPIRLSIIRLLLNSP